MVRSEIFLNARGNIVCNIDPTSELQDKGMLLNHLVGKH